MKHEDPILGPASELGRRRRASRARVRRFLEGCQPIEPKDGAIVIAGAAVVRQLEDGRFDVVAAGTRRVQR